MKKIFGIVLGALSVLTLASCGSSTTRNTVTPYGTLNSKLNEARLQYKNQGNHEGKSRKGKSGYAREKNER